MSALQVRNEIYEPKRLDAIYQNLIANGQAGRNTDYEIRVDNFPVIGKNNDPSRFMGYSDFITSDTKCISVFLYRSNGQSDKYFFHLKPEQFEKSEPLSGLNNQKVPESEEQIKSRLMKDLQYDELVRKNAELAEEVKEYEEIVDRMNKEIEQVKTFRDRDVMGWLGILGKGLMSGNTANTTNETMSGVNNSGQESNSCKRKGVEDVEEEKEIIELTDKEKGYLLFIDDVRNKIGEVELANVMHLLDLVASNPQAIHYAIRHVTNFLNQHAKETKEKSNEKV